MAKCERWYFSKEELENSPSRKCGIDAEKEANYRQQAANLIQDMGQKLKVTQLVINTAIVYMHRFFTFHSFTKFHRNAISACALFLAAKVEEQPRKLEHVIRVSQFCIYRENVDIKSEQYQRLASELVYNENLMLRTLGFDLSVQHPHTSIVNCCQLVRATKYIAETSYYLATNSLHLSTLCLQYKPTVVACICIYFVCKWSNFQFAKSTEGKDWWTYVDQTVNKEMLEQLMSECVAIFQKCPSRLKKCLGPSKTNNKLPNSPLHQLKQTEDIKPYEKSTLDNDHSKLNSKGNFDSRHQQNKSQHSTNAYNDYQVKKENSTHCDPLLNSDNSTNRSATKNVPHNSTSKLSSNFSSNKESPFFNLNQSCKNSATKDMSQVEDKFKAKELSGNNSFGSSSFDKMKSNLSVISNPLCNTNNSFNDNLIDSNALYSSDTDLSDLTFAHRKDFMPEFKMEFSDNDDSNPSDNNISLTSTLMMNDSNDSKSYTGKSNFDMAPNYDFKLKPNSFSHLPSKDLSGSIKQDIKLESNPAPASSFFSNSSLSLNTVNHSNNLLSNPLLSNHLPVEQYSDMNSKSDSMLSNTQKATNSSVNKKVSNAKSNMSGSTSNALNSIIDSIVEPKSTNFFPSNSSSKSLLNQSSILSNIPEPPVATNDHDNSSDYSSKRHKKKHKNKDKSKHKEKHKHKHKNKDKDKDKTRDKFNVEQSSFKVVSPGKNQSDKPGPIKLKISKQKVDTHTPSIEDEKQPSLKLRISLSNPQKSSSESPSNQETVSRKRKHDDKRR